MSTSELNAIRASFPEAVVQWCLFHVARAWMSKIRELVKLGSSALNAQAHRSLITALKKMMWEKDRTAFLVLLQQFITEFLVYPEFLSYFKRNYLDDDAFVRWSAAYQPQVFTNM